LTFISDETWFHLQGYINAQNNCDWSSQNPHLTYEVPLHLKNVGVWCAVSVRRTVGPTFFNETVNCERYVQVVLGQFFQQLTEAERLYGWFQQDSATAHTECISMQVLFDVVGDTVISNGNWSAPPDLISCDFSSGVV
jgi:hypothetical protein